MKSVFTIILSICIITTVFSQHRVWQFDFESKDVYVRTDTSHILHKATIDIPSSGHVLVKVEGECESSVGDMITFGVNDWNDWQSNFGNIGVIVFNEERRLNNFTHSRVFNVEQGQKDFYAVVQNWVYRDGNGYMSAKGRMIIEFIPDDEDIKRTFYKNIAHSKDITNPESFVLDTLEIEMAETGTVLLSHIGSLYASIGDEITLSIKPANINHPLSADQSFYFIHYRKGSIFNMNDTLRLPAGKHVFYVHGTRTANIEDDLEIGLYSVFSAVINYDSDLPTKTILTAFSTEINQINATYNFDNVIFEVPSKGSLLVMYSGQTDLISGQSLTVNANVNKNGNIEELSTQTWSTHIDDQKSYFYQSQLMTVDKGPIKIDMNAIIQGNNAIVSSQDIEGKLILKFIADPIISATSNISTNHKTREVYPNPTSGEIQISRKTSDQNNVNVSFYDLNGKIIKNLMSADHKININDLPSGTYIMSIQSDNNLELHKIIKVD